MPRLDRACRCGWARLAAALLIGRATGCGAVLPAAAVRRRVGGRVLASRRPREVGAQSVSADGLRARCGLASASRRATRLAWAIIAGSRFLSWTSSGVAMKIDE